MLQAGLDYEKLGESEDILEKESGVGKF